MKNKVSFKGSFLTNCLLEGRKGDPSHSLFYASKNSKNNNVAITVTLNGYAIIPMEKYCKLKGIHYDGKQIAEMDDRIKGTTPWWKLKKFGGWIDEL